MTSGVPSRPLPELTEDNRTFWTSGADGKLQILRCQSCAYYSHPPYPSCPRCLSTEMCWEQVSGSGAIYSFTINYQQWAPDIGSYVIALVELAEQQGLRLMTNIIDCEPNAVYIGQQVTVTFEVAEDVWLPLFTPVVP